MHQLIRNSFSPHKLRQLYVKAAFSNFVGFVAGSTVTLMTTYQTLERKGIKNLFGILPRKTVVVHRLPEWAEWALSIFIGYLVMESVRYLINNNKYLLSLIGVPREKDSDDAAQPSTGGRVDSLEGDTRPGRDAVSGTRGGRARIRSHETERDCLE
jgi:hypothetical protein